MMVLLSLFQGSSGEADTDRLADTGDGEGGMEGQSSMETCTLPHVNRQPAGICCMTQSSNRYSVTTERGGMGWEVGGRFKRKGTYVYLWLIHVAVWQKPTQNCKVVILQLKINKFFKKWKC